MTAKRELQLAVLLCLLGSALVLVALGQSWFSVDADQQLTINAVRRSVDGSKLAAGAQALGYVALAGVVALAATRRWGRVVVGMLVAMAGIGVVLVVSGLLLGGLQAAGRDYLHLSDAANQGHPGSSPGWAWLTIGGGAFLVLSGVLVAVRGRRWAALSSSYEVPAAQPVETPVTDKGVWDALDRGEDPT